MVLRLLLSVNLPSGNAQFVDIVDVQGAQVDQRDWLENEILKVYDGIVAEVLDLNAVMTFGIVVFPGSRGRGILSSAQLGICPSGKGTTDGYSQLV